MKNAALVLKTIYDNVPMILTIIAILAGIGIKVKNFLKQSKEEQKKQLQAQADKVVGLVKESLLSIVSKAEKEWGGGTGIIKKSWVWEQLQTQQQKLTEYISEGLIDKDMIDDLIEMAVEELNEIMEKNQKAADEVNPAEKK
nr:MAG TPA: holin [Caudoviricetes sp.]